MKQLFLGKDGDGEVKGGLLEGLALGTSQDEGHLSEPGHLPELGHFLLTPSTVFGHLLLVRGQNASDAVIQFLNMSQLVY